MYILGGEGDRVQEESMAAAIPLPDEEASLTKPVLVIFLWQSGQRAEGEGEGEGEGVVRKELVIGCVKTSMVKKVREGGREGGREREGGGRKEGRKKEGRKGWMN